MDLLSAGHGGAGAHGATLGRLIREGRLARYSKVGDRRGYVDRDELRKLLEFRKDKPAKT